MLSLSARAAGYVFEGSTEYEDFLDRIHRVGKGDVVHVHWTSPIAQAPESAKEARARVRRLDRAISRAKRRGAHLVWTVHNRLPHEMKHRDEEVLLYRTLAAAADRVHVMAPDTAAVLADVCTLPPERVTVLPHPSYEGVYDVNMTRADARASFDLVEGDYAVLFIGQIRPYKGVSSLLEAAARATPRSDRRIVLLIGGYASPDAVAEITASLPENVRTVLHLEFVPDGDISRWFAAADVAVFPYLQILNSGSIHLSATFGVPAIIPDEPHLRTQFADQRWIEFFSVEKPVESIAAILSSDSPFEGVAAADFDRYNEDLSPWKVAVAYHDLLEELTAERAAQGDHAR